MDRRAFLLTIVVLSACACSGPRVLSGYGDSRGPEGYPRRDGTHRGVDIGGVVGTSVIVAADGQVTIAGSDFGACGTMVMVQHHSRYQTVYCHLSSHAVRAGQEVRRGDLLGEIGTTGLRADPGFEHVHWELRNMGSHEDPLLKTVGCFDPKRSYPTDQFPLTYPVKC
jgi:murein DD-endopeptidase MepM/ murein hydrolase activator NlpD